MNQAQLPFFTIYLKDDIVAQQLQVQRDGLPVDISTATEIEIDIANDPAQATPFLQAKLSTNQIAVVNGPTGLLALTLTSAETTNLMAPQDRVNLDIVLTIAGKQRTYRVQNGLTVLARNT